MCSRCRGCSSRLRGFRLRAGYRVVSAGGRAPAPPCATRRAFGEHRVACLDLRRLLCHPAVLTHACAVLDSATDVPGKCCRRAMRASAQATIAVKSLPPEALRAGIRDGSSTSRPGSRDGWWPACRAAIPSQDPAHATWSPAFAVRRDTVERPASVCAGTTGWEKRAPSSATWSIVERRPGVPDVSRNPKPPALRGTRM